MPMLTVDQARARILAEFQPLAAEDTPLTSALGRVLAEEISATQNIPPIANSAMDGFAVRAADTGGASRANPIRLRVVGNIAAGYSSRQPLSAGEAMRIMTGAPLPPGADAVVRFEDTDEAGVPGGLDARGYQGLAAIADPPPSRDVGAQFIAPYAAQVSIYVAASVGQSVRAAGEDIYAGELVLKAGTVLRPAEIGVLASLGRAQVSVIRRPRIVILATGDELVEPGQPIDPLRGQIRNSNSYALAASVTRYGGEAINLGIARDNVADLSAKIDAGLALKPDLFVTSAGVSLGDYDIVKNVLNERGQMNFWKVNLRPGKPLTFGRLAGVPLLGLPGNPVSSLVTFDIFGRPALLKMQGKPGLDFPSVTATLTEPLRNGDGRRFYARMLVERDSATQEYTAHSAGQQGSGVMSTFTRANAYVVVPEEVNLLPAGSQVQALMFDWGEEVF
jgi:molybdopterin molybdotransferase